MKRARVECQCSEHQKPIEIRKWLIVSYKQRFVGHMSGVFGSKWIPSEKSTIRCLECGAIWITKEDYVEQLKARDNE